MTTKPNHPAQEGAGHICTKERNTQVCVRSIWNSQTSFRPFAEKKMASWCHETLFRDVLNVRETDQWSED
jgi:hypothetical protein